MEYHAVWRTSWREVWSADIPTGAAGRPEAPPPGLTIGAHGRGVSRRSVGDDIARDQCRSP